MLIVIWIIGWMFAIGLNERMSEIGTIPKDHRDYKLGGFVLLFIWPINLGYTIFHTGDPYPKGGSNF